MIEIKEFRGKRRENVWKTTATVRRLSIVNITLNTHFANRSVDCQLPFLAAFSSWLAINAFNYYSIRNSSLGCPMRPLALRRLGSGLRWNCFCTAFDGVR